MFTKGITLPNLLNCERVEDQFYISETLCLNLFLIQKH
jgi:hypothetical protein